MDRALPAGSGSDDEDDSESVHEHGLDGSDVAQDPHLPEPGKVATFNSETGDRRKGDRRRTHTTQEAKAPFMKGEQIGLARRLCSANAGALKTTGLLLAGSASTAFILWQSSYRLLFLIPLVTLLLALRCGRMGTALQVGLIAISASVFTIAGHGPIHEAVASPAIRAFVIFALLAANLLIGLSVAALRADRGRMAETLARSESELSLLHDNIAEAVLKIDAMGVCTYASPSVQYVLGRKPSDFVGHHIAERVHVEARGAITTALTRLLQGQSDNERLTYRRLLDDEERVPVFIEADCTAIFDPITRTRDGVIVSARDVTERVELELLLTRARRRALNTAGAKSDFLAKMSHEIRTPMNGVLGFAELMLQDDLDEEHRRHTEMIVESGRSVMMLLNDILDLSKIEAGQISIDKRPINLRDTLEDCIALHRAGATTKGLELKLVDDSARGEEPEEQGHGILTDGLRLRQIVLNLLSNAIKFTQSGSVTLNYAMLEDAVVLKVRDTGIGIDADRLESIFRPFTQAEDDTARRFGGTGLGLSISRQLGELLGGDLSVESTPGVGSTFTLFLPVERVADPLPDPGPVEARPTGALPQSGRILLAEDNDLNRALALEMLERCGQTVEIAVDGNEAIAMVLDSFMRGPAFDLVLMDIQMPRCDGYAATRAIRKEKIGPNQLPILALTANAFPDDIRAARAAGMQGHLAKPIKINQLAKALQRWLPTRIVEAPMDRDVTGSNGEDLSAHRSVERLTPTKEAAETGLQAAHSPALIDRWLARRSEAVELLRQALEDGVLAAKCTLSDEDVADRRADVAHHLHKLAGTAGTFGEAELGNKAALLEHAIKSDGKNGSEADHEALAFALLALADEPASD